MVDTGAMRALGRVFARLGPIEGALYVLWVAAWTLASARAFYGFMLKQTGGEWSAPLDDVFIHFDYARSTAEGHPFEWVPGNGYSSGNTSLTYPFVLAAGYLVGFRGMSLMVWAAIVAACSVFGALLLTRRLFIDGAGDSWGRLGSYLLPPVFLGVGALDWSLWSGMEVAFFLGTWGLALAAFVRTRHRVALGRSGGKAGARAAWLLGAACALMVVTRPEAVGTTAVFAIACAVAARGGLLPRLAVIARAATPGAALVVVQSVANRLFTGEWSANGAIVKLAVNHPYLTREDVLKDYEFNVKYAALRNLDYHFADTIGDVTRDIDRTRSVVHDLAFRASHASVWSLCLLSLGLLPLALPRVRGVALVMWLQIVLWGVIVAFNGQVRWQNERYVMPAVAWFLVLVALGVVEALRRGRPPSVLVLGFVFAIVVQTFGTLTRPAGMFMVWRYPWAPVLGVALAIALVVRYRPARVGLALLALFFAYDHQVSKQRDQIWFFGRASRNIRDQHVTMGRWLKKVKPRRVLVGDAGAIIYASEVPGLDIIGLGGYHDMPFARAGLHGLPATLELIERMPAADRPDVLALFPTWWGVLPTWFGPEVLERFPVEGNVICGGYEHVAYRADWRLLGSGERLRALPAGDRQVRDTLDVADLVSEKQHEYAFPRPAGGWADMRILADPASPARDMFDGGRRIAGGRSERFVLRGATPGAPAHLVFRTAPEATTTVVVKIDGAVVAKLPLERYEGWLEPAVAIPAAAVRDPMNVEVAVEGADFVDFHVWLTQ